MADRDDSQTSWRGDQPLGRRRQLAGLLDVVELLGAELDHLRPDLSRVIPCDRIAKGEK
jgi:hypothetical protein